MIEDIIARIHQRLDELELTPRAASLEAGLSEDAIRNIDRAAKTGSHRGMTVTTIAALAPVLKTSIGWLLGDPSALSEVASESVPVVGYVGAGSVATLFAEGQGPLDYVEPPQNANERTVGLKVQGSSLGPAWDEAVIFYDDVRSPVTSDLHGRLCVVGLPDGRVLVKILKAANDGSYHLLSNTAEEPLLNQAVAWAARVTAAHPR